VAVVDKFDKVKPSNVVGWGWSAEAGVTPSATRRAVARNCLCGTIRSVAGGGSIEPLLTSATFVSEEVLPDTRDGVILLTDEVTEPIAVEATEVEVEAAKAIDTAEGACKLVKLKALPVEAGWWGKDEAIGDLLKYGSTNISSILGLFSGSGFSSLCISDLASGLISTFVGKL